MPFLMYRDNDSGLRPSSYPYILGRSLNQYRINTSVTIYILNYKGKVNITYCMKLVKIDPAKLLMIFKHGDYNSQLSTKSSQTVLMHATSPCIKVVLEYTQNQQTGSNIDITFNSDRPS